MDRNRMLQVVAKIFISCRKSFFQLHEAENSTGTERKSQRIRASRNPVRKEGCEESRAVFSVHILRLCALRPLAVFSDSISRRKRSALSKSVQ